jgi:hypothetical protein
MQAFGLSSSLLLFSQGLVAEKRSVSDGILRVSLNSASSLPRGWRAEEVETDSSDNPRVDVGG